MLDVSDIQLADISGDEFAQLMAVLGDPARIIILSHLAMHSKSGETVRAADFRRPLGLSQPVVSHHVNRLKAVGLVNSEKCGRERYLTLNFEKLAAVREALMAIKTGQN